MPTRPRARRQRSESLRARGQHQCLADRPRRVPSARQQFATGVGVMQQLGIAVTSRGAPVAWLVKEGCEFASVLLSWRRVVVTGSGVFGQALSLKSTAQ